MAVKVDDNEGDVMAEINITPFTDVLLVLLIIFMIAATSVIQNSLGIKLPRAVSTDKMQDANIVISITNDSLIHVGTAIYARSELLKALQDLQRARKTDRVVIMADGHVKYAEVISVMDVARDAGLTSIALATRPRAGQTPTPAGP